MTNLLRMRVGLTGFIGGPGVATMYFLDVSTAVESVSRLWGEFSRAMPSDVTITPQRVGDTIEDTTGALTGSWVGGVVTPHIGAKAEAYAAPVGAVATWLTNSVLDVKRLRGRTFVVPLAQSSYTAAGQIDPGVSIVFQNAMTQFIVEQSVSAVIWHRPFKGRAATATRPARPPHAGGHGLITASRVPSLAAVLRSRRD